MKRLWAAALGLIGLLYLVNPGAGLFEIIPDNLPLAGNLDEAGAALLVLAALRYFGIDLTTFLRPPRQDADPDARG